MTRRPASRSGNGPAPIPATRIEQVPEQQQTRFIDVTRSEDRSATVVIPDHADHEPTQLLDAPAAHTQAMRPPTAVPGTARAARQPGRLRTNLPDDLLQRYRPLYNLKVSAGQADLVRAIRLADDMDVVVKLYKSSTQLDRDVLQRLYRANPKHVVRLLEHGQSQGEPWEVQEFCRHGNLAEYCIQQGGRLPSPVVREIVVQLTEAVGHVQALGITHRDLKPANILVRSIEPHFDLVLTDFGVAADQVATVMMQTVAATWPWAAPEVHTKGQVARPIDWWALGAIIHQLYTGHHLLAGPDGRMPNDREQRATIVDGRYTAEAMGTGRWRDLVDGLLSYHPRDRWGYDQVRAWLAGKDPLVVRTQPIDSQPVVARPRAATFVLNGRRVSNGATLVAAIRAGWEEAYRLLAEPISPQFEQWLRTVPGGAEALAAMRLEQSVGGRWVRLQAAFDPGQPLEYRGLRLDQTQLELMIGLAKRWHAKAKPEVQAAHDWLARVRDERVLRAAAAVLDGEWADDFAQADALLDRWRWQAAEVQQRVPVAPLQGLVEERDSEELAGSFAVALGLGDDRDTLRQASRRARKRTPTQLPWAEDLAEVVRSAEEDDRGLVLAADAVLAEVDQRSTELVRQRKSQHRTWRRQLRRQTAHMRREQLARQLPTRLVLGALYAGGSGAVIGLFSGDMQGAAIAALIVYGITAIGITVASATEWFTGNTPSGLRRAGTWIGLAFGLAPWFGPVNLQEVTLYGWAPLGLGAGWAAGSLANHLLNRAVERRPVAPRGLRPLAGFTGTLVALGLPAGVSALLFQDGSGILGADAWRFASPLPLVDPFGLADQPTLVAGLSGVAIILQLAAVRLGRLARPLGVTAALVAGLLGLLVLLGQPTNLLWGLIASYW
ncbi:MAG: protein kinase domain-containing protein [Brooklawnia sp.]|jgi:hypothetical protein